MRILVSNLILAAASAAIGTTSISALATQHPDKSAWEELNPASEAYSVMKRKCELDAGEVILETREGVRGVYHESDDNALSYITGSPTSYGISFTNPPYTYLGLGLYYVEFRTDLSAARRFGRLKELEGYLHQRFDTQSYDTTPSKERTTSIKVIYKRTTTDIEERVGVHGRLIEVIDELTNKTLAQRRDYVWLNPNRNGPHGGFVCPTLQHGESLPGTFLNRVVNVNTYPCGKIWEQAMRALPNKRSFQEIGKINAASAACSSQFYKK